MLIRNAWKETSSHGEKSLEPLWRSRVLPWAPPEDRRSPAYHSNIHNRKGHLRSRCAENAAEEEAAAIGRGGGGEVRRVEKGLVEKFEVDVWPHTAILFGNTARYCSLFTEKQASDKVRSE